jgi:hypothetical protein
MPASRRTSSSIARLMARVSAVIGYVAHHVHLQGLAFFAKAIL